LSPLNIEDIKSAVNDGKQGKKSKALWDAYKVVSEQHDLAYFKNMLAEHEERRRQLEQEEAERAAKKAAKEAKKKSKEAAADEDAEMEDVEEDGEGAKAPKSSKKRKKDVDSEGETSKVRFRHSCISSIKLLTFGSPLRLRR
jgi:sRNA-binding protein